MNNKVINKSDVTQLDKQGNIVSSNESSEYALMDKETGVSKEVSKEEFMKVNASNPLKNKITIDDDNRIVSSFEKFNQK
jgi:hypothetical protein